MAYYGPNADILGSIKLKIWHYETVIENIEKFVLNLLSLFFIDVISFAVNGILFWHFCKLNVLEVINNLQKSFSVWSSITLRGNLGEIRNFVLDYFHSLYFSNQYRFFNNYALKVDMILH